MRAFQVFASIKPEHARKVIAAVAESSPAAYTQALAAAGAAMRARPVFLMRQPAEKRADAIRQALSRVRASDVAEEVLATYFLDCRKDLLAEWLDLLELPHEEGVLQGDDPKEPEEAVLRDVVQKFRSGDDSDDRELLLRAFAAQTAIDWPRLEVRLAEDAG